MDSNFTLTPENAPQKKHSWRWILWLILILVLAAGARFGYQWWQQHIQTHAVQAQAAQQTVSQEDQTIARVQQQTAALAQQATAMNQAFSQLQQQVQQLQQNSRPATMALLDAQQLVELAQLSLASNNAASSLNALQSAQAALAALPAASNADLFASIAQDIQAVQAFQSADHSAQTILQLDQLAENFSDFTLETVMRNAGVSTPDTTTEPNSLWQKGLKAVSPYIQIQRQGDHSIRDANFFSNIQQTVSAKLLQAENALLAQRLDAYQADLQFVQTLVKTSSFSTSTMIQEWLNRLGVLMSANAAPQMPSFQHTQDLLKSHLQATQTTQLMMPGPVMPVGTSTPTNVPAPSVPTATTPAPQKPIQTMHSVEA